MDEVLRGLPYVYAYIDDILVASKDEDSHKQHLPEVFRRFSHYGLRLNLDKCLFGAPSIEFLRHSTDAEGITSLPTKISAIQDFPTPTSIRQLRRFIGMINFYRRFIPNCSTILRPFTNLLLRKNRNISLETNALHAFNAAKTALVNFTKLSYIKDDPQMHLTLTTDASDAGVGAIYRILFSQAFTNTEKVQYLFTRVAGHILGRQAFQNLLEGRDFVIYTDHKPLTTVMRTNSDKYTPWEIRHLDYLSQFSTDIRHVKGKDNTVADTLSWTEIHALENDVLSQDLIAKEQKSDSTFQGVKTNTSLKLQEFPVPLSDGKLYCEISQANPRPYSPARHYENKYFDTYTDCHTRVNARLSNSLLNASFGPTWTQTSANGSLCVWNANSVKSTGTPNLLLAPSAILMHGFPTYTSTWSDQCQCVRTTNTYWRWWTTSHDGPPLGLSRSSQQALLVRSYWKNG